MELQDCDRERDVIEAVQSGRWPEGTAESLRRHVQECRACSDAALVATYLAQEAGSAGQEAARAELPHPGLIWWRAQIMARREAAERAAQPIALAQRVALAVAVAVVAAAAAIGWFRFPEARTRIVRWFAASRALDMAASLMGGVSATVLLASLSACVMLAGFVLYIVWAED